MQRFFRFALVGAVGTLSHWGVLIAAVEAGGLSPVAATALGAAAGAAVNYLLNRRYTFASRRPHAQAAPRFFAIALLGLLLNAAIVALGTQLGLHYLLAQAAATAIVLLVGFRLSAAWAFPSR